MTVHKLIPAMDYFKHMVGKTIEEVAIFNDELVIILDDMSEVCIYEGEYGLTMQINSRPELDD